MKLIAKDLQTLVRKMYAAEGLDRTKMTLAEKHAVQKKYVVTRTNDRYEATLQPI